MINTSETIVELDYVLHKFRKVLRPANIGAATIKLEQLRRYEQSTPHSHKVLRVAAELHKYVETYSDRLSLTQVANVVRGMSSVQYRLPPQLLVRLAAGLLVEEGAAVRYAADSDVRDVFYGFAGQGFTNPLFWSRLCAAVLPRLESFEPNALPGLVKALEMARQLPAAATAAQAAEPVTAAAAAAELTAQVAVARAALRLVAGSLERLQPGRLADAAGLLVAVAPQLDAARVDEQLAARLQAAAMPCLPSFNPNQLTSLLLSLVHLRQAAATASAASTSTSALPPPLPADLLAAAVPHLRAAAPTMQLLHVKRAVQALAPSVVAAAAANAAAPATNGSAPALAPLLNLLARRAALLLPSAAELAAGAPRTLTRGTLAHVPRGGKGAGAVLTAAAPAGDPRVSLDGPLLGLLEGLVRAYSRVLPPSRSGGAAGAASDAADVVMRQRQQQLPDVAALFAHVGRVAAAARARGLLAEEQRLSLAVRLPLLLEEEALLAPLVLAPATGPAAVAAEAHAGAGAGAGAAALGAGAGGVAPTLN